MTRINVTKTFLPPLEEYQAYLQQIWAGGQVTNQGPLLKQFEATFQQQQGVKNFHFVSNGTIALQVALRALDLTEGEIITTPFSYVATTSAILWERCSPVYVDINRDDLCIDVTKIEAAITPKTKAIMAVHVFGNACDVEAIETIANRHNLKVIYDAAHAFNVQYKDQPLLNYGDIATYSFHATKLFHTIEGGGLVVNNSEISKRVELIKRFGQEGDEHYFLGTNAKASELQAAMGLCNLNYVEKIIEARQKISQQYDQLLKDRQPLVSHQPEVKPNYAYYPILFKDEAQVLALISHLQQKDIYPRRYFYPSLNTLSYVNGAACPVSEEIASRIICLPLYVGLEPTTVELIAQEVNKVIAT